MSRGHVLAILLISLIACHPNKDAQVRGAWQYQEDSLTYTMTFADNHAFVEAIPRTDVPLTGNWRVDGNYLIITIGLRTDPLGPRADTTEIIKVDGSSMILRMPSDSLNKSLKILSKLK